MEQVSAELQSIRQLIQSRDQLDMERRKVDDTRNDEAKARAAHLLERADGHGQRLRTLEVNWSVFFSENGAFTYVKKKIDATEQKLDDADHQNRWIIRLIVATLIGVIVNMALKR